MRPRGDLLGRSQVGFGEEIQPERAFVGFFFDCAEFVYEVSSGFGSLGGAVVGADGGSGAEELAFDDSDFGAGWEGAAEAEDGGGISEPERSEGPPARSPTPRLSTADQQQPQPGGNGGGPGFRGIRRASAEVLLRGPHFVRVLMLRLSGSCRFRVGRSALGKGEPGKGEGRTGKVRTSNFEVRTSEEPNQSACSFLRTLHFGDGTLIWLLR